VSRLLQPRQRAEPFTANKLTAAVRSGRT